MIEQKTRGDPIRTVPLDEERLTALLDRLDGRQGEIKVNRRQVRRFSYRANSCIVHMQQPGAGGPVSYTVATRNISANGLAFLHGGFVHQGTLCTAVLQDRAGAWREIAGVVVRCRYLEGRMHEVAVLFKEPVNPGELCADADQRRLLLIGHDAKLARSAGLHLKKFNCEVEHLEPDESVADHVGQEDYDAILVDLDAPDGAGLAAVRGIRESGCLKPIVACAQSIDTAQRREALEAACDLCLDKPFAENDLVEMLDWVGQDPSLSEYRDDQDMKPLVDQFVAAIPQQLCEFEEAYAAEDNDRLANLAKTLRGEGGSHGFGPITVVAGNVERALLDKQPRSGIRAQLNELARCCLLARTSHRNAGQDGASAPNGSE